MEVMHITVSLKDHSSICTCMLLIKKKNLNDWTETRTSPQTNKQLANERGGSSSDNRWRGWGQNGQLLSRLPWTEQWETDVHSNASPHLSSTLNMAVPRRLLRVNVMMSYERGATCSRQKQLKSFNCSKYIIWSSAHSRFIQQISAETVLLLSVGCFCVSSCQTCQPWTFCSTISALAKMPICVISASLKKKNILNFRKMHFLVPYYIFIYM